MSDIYTSVEQLIGNTPLLRLDRLGAQEGWKARCWPSWSISTPAARPRTGWPWPSSTTPRPGAF